jgi:hypothetical protein
MKKKTTFKKLALRKQTIHTLGTWQMQQAKGGTASFNNGDDTHVYTLDQACWFPTVTNTATNDQSCPGGYSCQIACADPGPGASAITRCATGGLCIPTYNCSIGCQG